MKKQVVEYTGKDLEIKYEEDRMLVKARYSVNYNVIFLSATTLGILLPVILMTYLAGNISLFYALSVLFGSLSILFYKLGTRHLHLEVNQKELTLKKGPLSSKNRIPSSNIEQLFVKQSMVSSSESYYSYELWAKMADGKNTCLIGPGVFINPNNALHLEELLEYQLNIPDYHIPKELSTDRVKALKEDFQQRLIKPKDSNNPSLFDLVVEDLFDYGNSHWIIKERNQFDWTNGVSDVSLKCKSGTGTLNLFLHFDLGKTHNYVEEQVSQEDRNFLSSIAKSHEQINWNESSFFKFSHYAGKRFSIQETQGIEVQQILFLNEAFNKSLRILLYPDYAQVFAGEKVPEIAFDHLLKRKSS